MHLQLDSNVFQTSWAKSSLKYSSGKKEMRLVCLCVEICKDVHVKYRVGGGVCIYIYI